jgi:hypothetical protein
MVSSDVGAYPGADLFPGGHAVPNPMLRQDTYIQDTSMRLAFIAPPSL